jgi:hypothetical protein
MKEKLKITRGSGNVFLDIEFPSHETQDLVLRSHLMIETMIEPCSVNAEAVGAAKRNMMSQLATSSLRPKDSDT